MRQVVRAGAHAVAAAGMAGLVLAVAGCGGSGPERTSYTFNPTSSAVKVDTPQLRALKAAADIQACPASAGAGADAVPGGLPDVTLPCLGGGSAVDLAALRGPLVLNFWSQTCGPCREESPLLQRFATAAHGSVRVMGVDFYDPRPGYAIEFAKQLAVTYPQLADPDAATKAALRIAGLPMTFLVAPSGRIAYTQVGAISSEQQLEALVRRHLGVSLPARPVP